jgi:hypothetical protein
MAHVQLHSLLKMLNFYSYVGLTEATPRDPTENGSGVAFSWKWLQKQLP